VTAAEQAYVESVTLDMPGWAGLSQCPLYVNTFDHQVLTDNQAKAAWPPPQQNRTLAGAA